MPVDRLGERRFAGFARGKLALVDDSSGNARLRGEFQAPCAGPIADHRGDFRGQPGAHDRLHVAAAPRDENDDLLHASILLRATAKAFRRGSGAHFATRSARRRARGIPARVATGPPRTTPAAAPPPPWWSGSVGPRRAGPRTAHRGAARRAP